MPTAPMEYQARPKESVSFVLRLWLEPGGLELPEWRWHVHHVQSGEQRYFRRLADVLTFVAERSKVAPPEWSRERE